MTRHTDIIARLKEAKGPDRELFGDACRLVIPNTIHAWNEHSRFIRLIDAEAWIDAALTLMPEGCSWTIIKHENGGCLAEVGEAWQHAGATPALALLIAIVEAREGMDGKDG